jgi:ABC-type branched-subunit amino acid transport system ATPase component
MSVPQPLLDIRSVTVRFGGLVANNEIDLNVEAG